MKSERLLLAHLEGGNWEIRVVTRRAPWWKRWIARGLQALREARAARELALFDERMLNDIGLGPNAGNSLATRIHCHRQCELRRITMAQRGLI